MYRFKLSAILLSLLARLGLAEPNYSILDESSNRWLSDDSILTGLNTIYNSITQGLQDKHDKKRRPMSVIAAAIVEYLSSDLTEEQDKLNSALNVITRRVNTKSQDDEFLRNKVINENEATLKTPDTVRIEDNSNSNIRDFEDLSNVKYRLRVLLDTKDIKDTDINKHKYDYSLTDTDRQIIKTP